MTTMTLAAVPTPGHTGVIGDGSWRVTRLTTWLGAGGVPTDDPGFDCGHALPGSTVRREIGGRVTANLVLPIAAWPLVRRRDVLLVDLPNGDFEEVRVVAPHRSLDGTTCQVQCSGPFADLADSDLIRETIGGRVLFAFDVTRPPLQLLAQYVLRDLAEDGLPWLHPVPGPVEFPDAIPVNWQRWTRGQLLDAMKSQTLGEISWTRLSDFRYQVGLVQRVGASAAPIPVFFGDGVLSHELDESNQSLLTVGRVHGEVEGTSGENATLGENRWRVHAIRTLDDGRPAIALRELFGDRSPVLCNGQWGARPDVAPPIVGRWLQRADAVTHLAIQGAIASTGEIILLPGTVPDVGERVTITADGTGTPLTLCEITTAMVNLGRVVKDVFVPGGRGERQYLTNGGLETDATGWSAHNSGDAAYIRRSDLPADFTGEIATARDADTGTGTPLELENLPVTTPATRLYKGDTLVVEAVGIPTTDATFSDEDGALALPVAPLAAAIPAGTLGTLSRRATAATRTITWGASVLSWVSSSAVLAVYAFDTPPSGGTYLDNSATPPTERWRGYDLVDVTPVGGSWAYQDPADASVISYVAGSLPARLAREVLITDSPPFTERFRLLVAPQSLAPAPGWILRADLTPPLLAATDAVVTLQRDRIAVEVIADADVSDTEILLAPITPYARPSTGFAQIAIAVTRTLTWNILSWSLVEVEPGVFRPVIVVDPTCTFHTDSDLRAAALAGGHLTVAGSFGWPSGVTNVQTLISVTPIDGSPTHYAISWQDLEDGYNSPLSITTGSRTFTWREGISLGALSLAATYGLSGTDAEPMVETTATVSSTPVVPAGAAVHVGFSTLSTIYAEAQALAAAIADEPTAWRAPTGKLTSETDLLLTVGDPRRRTALNNEALLPWPDDVLGLFGAVFIGPTRVAAGSMLQLEGETLIVGADVDVAGDGTADVTLAVPNTLALGAGTIVRCTRPDLLDPTDRTTGRVIRLLDSVGGDGEPSSSTPGQTITAEVVRVPANGTRTLTFAAEFTLGAGTWYPGNGPVIAIIAPDGEVLGWSALAEGVVLESGETLNVRVVGQATVAATGLYTARVYGGSLATPLLWILYRQGILAVTTAGDVPYTRDSFASAMWLTAGPSCVERSSPRIEDRLTFRQLAQGMAAALGLPTAAIPPITLGGTLDLRDAAIVAPLRSSVDDSLVGRSVRIVAEVLRPDRDASELELGAVSASGSLLLASASLAAGVRRLRG